MRRRAMLGDERQAGAVESCLHDEDLIVENKGTIDRNRHRLLAGISRRHAARRTREQSYAALFHPIAMWRRAEDDQRFIAATGAFCEAMRPYTTGGVYLNLTPEERVRDIFGPAKYERLVAVKDRYDPGNLFRLNQNIKPSRLSGMAAHA